MNYILIYGVLFFVLLLCESLLDVKSFSCVVS